VGRPAHVAISADAVRAAPDVMDRLIRRRGWNLDRYEQCLAETMADALLGPGG
jgi:hypothetical protein